MLLPVIGMILGFSAVFITYRKPREYNINVEEPTTKDIEAHIANIKTKTNYCKFNRNCRDLRDTISQAQLSLAV